MKKITFSLILLSAFSFAQQQYPTYSNLWKEVTALESKSLPKSALKIVDKIYQKAQKSNNTPQIVKSLLYQSKYALILEEDATLKVVNQFRKEIAKSKFPTKNILENILANMYWQYFQQNRWKFYQRTKTTQKVNKTDFRTWDLTTIFNEIDTYFKSSLQNSEKAQRFSLKSIDVLFIQEKNSQKYRPTLFDFLVHNALLFYKTPENSLTQPVNKFEIDNPKYISDYKEFITIKIPAKNHVSLQQQALILYQKLLRFHTSQNNTDALVVADVERLKFVKNNAVFSQKESLFLEALRNVKKEVYNAEISTFIDFEMAVFLSNQGQQIFDKPSVYPSKKAKAYAICKEALQKFPNSFGAKKCKALISSIEQTSLNITGKEYIPVQKHSKILVSYQNINRLYFHFYKISQKEKESFNKLYKKSKKNKFIKKLKKTTFFYRELINKKDFLKHSAELAMPPMPKGQYLVVSSSSPKITEASVYATYFTQVTNIALIENKSSVSFGYQVVNRITGQPLHKATVNITNTNNRFYNKHITLTASSDKNGKVQFNDNNKHNYVTAKVTYQDDVAYFGNYYISKTYHNAEKPIHNHVHLFTDRSIYRPGQIIYFKGIAYSKNTLKRNSEVLTNTLFSVSLLDVNYQKMKTIDVKTNEFGSFSGTFVLPKQGLTGEYRIQLKSKEKFSYNSGFILVEEYKRPKFEAVFKPIAKTYKINETITAKGKAIAFSGSTLSNAKVVYRVKREVQYPQWYFWYRPYVRSEAQEITYGTSETDAQGNFNVSFKAIPDKSVDRKNQPVFSYKITADVTDVNGETHTAETTVKVGYQALILHIDVPEQTDKKNSLNVQVVAKNLNGTPVKNKGIIRIFKLQSPLRVFKKRDWAAPDFQLISKEEYRRYFPYSSYQNEERFTTWKSGDLMWEHTYQSEKELQIVAKELKKWPSGKYKVEVETQDQFGKTVIDKKIITLTAFDAKKVADKKLFSIHFDKKSYKAGESVKVKIGTAAKELTLTLEVEHQGKITNTQIITLRNEIKEFTFPMYRLDVDGFAIHYSFSFYNSFEKGTLIVPVKEIKEDYQIETLTFRDKLQPGQKEIWSFQLKNHSKKDVSAEFLAGMYDISLDQFRPHHWDFTTPTFETYRTYYYVSGNRSFNTQPATIWHYYQYHSYPQLTFDRFNWFGFYFRESQGRLMMNKNIRIRGAVPEAPSAQKIEVQDEYEEVEEMAMSGTEPVQGEYEITEDFPNNGTTSKKVDFSTITIRKNFNETAFFYPQLKTDKNGAISFEFTTPEALTQWKLQLLAHTKNMSVAQKIQTVKTQKELMVIPNTPRFLREGDDIVFSAKIANISNKSLLGVVKLELTNAFTGKNINVLLKNTNAQKEFTVDAKGNTFVTWKLSIPKNLQAVQYKVLAKAGRFSDGEQNVLPVLNNRMLVTETMPLWVTSNNTKTFTLNKLKNISSSTLQHQKYTLEITSNPAWYALQSLPYLMESPFESNEQSFSRLYANALGSFIVNSQPVLKKVFDQWENSDALLSNLEKNQELKSILIEETPWLRDAQNESEQKKRIALLFNINTMQYELKNVVNKLANSQNKNGSWAWFSGGYPNRWITQHIVAGFGHLQHLGVSTTSKTMIAKAIRYLDSEFVKECNQLKIRNVDFSKNHLSSLQLHYLYMRSFFKNEPMSSEVKKGVSYYLEQIEKYWTKNTLYQQGLMSLVSHRNGKSTTAKAILRSLRENSIYNEEMGMYWKSNVAGYFYYQAPVETQSLLIEAFSEIENDVQIVDKLKMWLLKNKQTNRWKTTKATTEAVYALLLQGSNWVTTKNSITVRVGQQQVIPSKEYKNNAEAGTGYYKTSWNGKEITPNKATVTITKKDKGIAWGGVYWQYFENLDKITPSKTPLKINKKLFLKKDTPTGKQLTEITKNTPVKVGDLITVRTEITVDRQMEFIHLKDMRASGLEPVNVLSAYRWQDGLGYYQSTKDTATHFFFDVLPKGIYVFEYDLRVNNAGNFSNGITTIQCMYAPEFSSHSKRERINVEEVFE